jgi:hypothetical protein
MLLVSHSGRVAFPAVRQLAKSRHHQTRGDINHAGSEKRPTTRLVQRGGGRKQENSMAGWSDWNSTLHLIGEFSDALRFPGCIVRSPIWRAAPTSIADVSMLTERFSRFLY